MKSTIAKCLQDMLKESHGRAVWGEILEAAGLSKHTVFLTAGNVDSGDVITLFGAASQVTGLRLETVMRKFGIYWSTQYAPVVYELFYKRYDDARSFMRALSDIHATVTRSIPRAEPPRFDYLEDRDDFMRVRYVSKRGLIQLMPGLLEGLGLYFGQRVETEILPDQQLAIRFRGPCERVMPRKTAAESVGTTGLPALDPVGASS